MKKLSRIINLVEKKEVRSGMLDFSKIGKEVREQHRLALYIHLVNQGKYNSKLHINK